MKQSSRYVGINRTRGTCNADINIALDRQTKKKVPSLARQPQANTVSEYCALKQHTKCIGRIWCQCQCHKERK